MNTERLLSIRPSKGRRRSPKHILKYLPRAGIQRGILMPNFTTRRCKRWGQNRLLLYGLMLRLNITTIFRTSFHKTLRPASFGNEICGRKSGQLKFHYFALSWMDSTAVNRTNGSCFSTCCTVTQKNTSDEKHTNFLYVISATRFDVSPPSPSSVIITYGVGQTSRGRIPSPEQFTAHFLLRTVINNTTDCNTVA